MNSLALRFLPSAAGNTASARSGQSVRRHGSGTVHKKILDSLETEGRRQTPELITHRIATAACKAAVKGNQMLSVPEADKLIDELRDWKILITARMEDPPLSP